MSEIKKDTYNEVIIVDDLVTSLQGEWKFSKQVADVFDSHVRKSVPIYDDMQNMVLDMSEWFVKDNSTIFDLGSSTGKTLNLLSNRHKNKNNIQYIGLDNSVSMVEKAIENRVNNNIEFKHQDITNMKDFKKSSLVLSLYTLQFMTLNDRYKVLKKVYDDLEHGGGLIIAEKVHGESSFFEDIWIELYWDMKKQNGLSDDAILNKARSLRGVLRPLSFSENINILKEVGFKDIDIFMKWYNFAGFIAVKK